MRNHWFRMMRRGGIGKWGLRVYGLEAVKGFRLVKVPQHYIYIYMYIYIYIYIYLCVYGSRSA